MAIKLPFFRPRDKGFKDTAEVTAETMPSARHSLARLGMILVLAGALVIVATGLFFQTDAARRIADSQQREIQLEAGNLTAALAELLAQRTEKMERLVRDPAIIAQAENPAGAPVQHRETELAYLFPRAVGIRILPAGLDEVDIGLTADQLCRAGHAAPGRDARHAAPRRSASVQYPSAAYQYCPTHSRCFRETDCRPPDGQSAGDAVTGSHGPDPL